MTNNDQVVLSTKKVDPDVLIHWSGAAMPWNVIMDYHMCEGIVYSIPHAMSSRYCKGCELCDMLPLACPANAMCGELAEGLNTAVATAELRLFRALALYVGAMFAGNPSEIYGISVLLRTWWVGSHRVFYQPCRVTRNVFNGARWLTRLRSPSTHPHPVSAGVRTRASNSLNQLAKKLGLNRYDISIAERDGAISGTRAMVHPLDVSAKFRFDDIPDNPMFTAVDTDYYLTPSELRFYLSHGVTVFWGRYMSKLCYKTPEGQCSFQDGELVEFVRGGPHGVRSYKHPVYNYPDDRYVVRHGWFGCYITEGKISRVIDPGMEGRHFVCFTPCATVWDPLRLISEALPQPLNVEVVSRAGLPPVYVHTYCEDGVDMVSVKESGSSLSYEMPYQLYENFRVNNSYSKNSNNRGEVGLMIDDHVPGLSKAAAGTLLIGLTSLLKDVDVPLVRTVAELHPLLSFELHSEERRLGDEPSAPIVGIVGPQVVAVAALTPESSERNDRACVEGRVEAVRNNVRLDENLKQWAHEFVCQLVRRPNRGSPLLIQAVYDCQKKRAQRARNEDHASAALHPKDTKVKAMQKNESYGKVTDPRNISTLPTNHTVMFSRFTLAFKKQVLLKQKWYAVGRSPLEIAQMVQNFAKENSVVVETDFSRFDGTITKDIRRHLEVAMYRRWYKNDYKSEVTDLVEAEINANGRTRFGVKYELKGSRPSGSPSTSDANSVVNAFSDFVAWKLAGKSTVEAYNSIGPKCGDDSLSSAPADRIVEACTNLGLKVKIEHEVKQKDEPIRFLGRVFIRPRYSLRSFADPLRTVQKIHLTHAQLNPKANVRCARVAGYLVTDATTPVITDYCQAILRLEGKHNANDQSALTALAAEGGDHNYFLKVTSGSWAFNAVHDFEDEVITYIAGALGTTAAAIAEWRACVQKAGKDTEWPILGPAFRSPAVPGSTVRSWFFPPGSNNNYATYTNTPTSKKATAEWSVAPGAPAPGSAPSKRRSVAKGSPRK